MRRYELLCEKITRLKAQPQSAEGELALITLEWERDSLQAERQIKVLRLAKLLVEAYRKTGSMTVIYPSGQTRTERPAHTTHPVQGMWNLKWLARSMAEAVTPYE